MSMIFEFEKMEDAEAFVSAVKVRWNLGGKVFDDGDGVIAFIDRVWAENDAEAAEIKRRFGLTDDEIAGWQKRFPRPPEWKTKALAGATRKEPPRKREPIGFVHFGEPEEEPRSYLDEYIQMLEDAGLEEFHDELHVGFTAPIALVMLSDPHPHSHNRVIATTSVVIQF